MASRLPHAWIVLEETDRQRLMTWAHTGEWTARGGEEREWEEEVEPPSMPATFLTLQAVYSYWARVLAWAEKAPSALEAKELPHRSVDLHLKPPPRVVRPAAKRVVAEFERLVSLNAVNLDSGLDARVPFEHWRRSDRVLERLREMAVPKSDVVGEPTASGPRREAPRARLVSEIMTENQWRDWWETIRGWTVVCSLVVVVCVLIALVLG